MFKFIYKYRFHLIAGFVLASLFLFFINQTTPPSIQSTSLSNDQTNVMLDVPVDIAFTTPTTARERRHLAFNIVPPIVGSPTWDSPNTIVRLNPYSTLTKNTHYTIDILYKNKSIYTLSFTTNPYDEADLHDQANKQAADDLIFGQKVSESLQQRPWLSSLPIRTPSYYIYFDTPSQQFLFYFIAPQTPILEQQAIDALKKLGVPTQDLKYTVVN